MAELDPETWVELQAACNNQTQCDFEAQGNVVDACLDGDAEPPFLAEYMEVTYSCNPGMLKLKKGLDKQVLLHVKTTLSH